MNDNKPAGWYYVGDGKLRYRDEYGWTDFHMETSDPRAAEWPPAAPRTLLAQVRDDEARLSTKAPSRRWGRGQALSYKGRHAK